MGTAVTDATVTVNGQAVTRQGEWWQRSVTIPNTAGSTWNEFKVAGVRPGAGPGGTDAVATSVRKTWLPKTPEAFTYDADGNLTGDGRWTYTWDGENRLSAMETRADILPPLGNFPLTERRKLEFVYDGQGRRVAKKVSTWTGTTWQLVTSTLFLYDGWNLIAELNALSSNAPVRTYTWGLDLSGSMQGAGGVGGLLFANLGSATHAAAFDGTGNVIGLVDMATGAKSATYEYSAFGETLVSDGVAAVANTFRFSTKYTDNETGLLYYGLRYYSPGTGRWISKDPINEPGAHKLRTEPSKEDIQEESNLYRFVFNNSLTNFDPNGLCTVWLEKRNVDYLGNFLGKVVGVFVKHWFLKVRFEPGDLSCCQAANYTSKGLYLEAGLGEEGGNLPGQEYHVNPFRPTQPVDHGLQSLQTGTTETLVTPPDGMRWDCCKLYEFMTNRSPTGRRFPFYNCHGWTCDVINGSQVK